MIEAAPLLARFAGGALIGGAVAWLLLLDGRVAGISGILSGAVVGDEGGERGWPSDRQLDAATHDASATAAPGEKRRFNEEYRALKQGAPAKRSPSRGRRGSTA